MDTDRRDLLTAVAPATTGAAGDNFLAEHDLDGYIALPAKDSTGRVTGYLASPPRGR